LARPFALSESNQIKNEKHEIIPYDELVQRRLKDLEDWNNSAHSVETSKTRWEYFLENQNPDLKPTNYKGIIRHLGYKTPTSCNVGSVRLQGGMFLIGDNGKILFSDSLINVMSQIEGKDIDVYWLDDNEGKVMKAYAYLNDNFICELIAKPIPQRSKIERTREDVEMHETMSKYMLSVEAFGKRSRNSIDKVTVINNKPFTLNNKFSISGIRNQEVRIKNEETEVEVLEPVEDDYVLIPTVNPQYQPFRDRF
jgi:hypothetical protein